MGAHLNVLREGFPMNTNITGFRWFSKPVAFLCLDKNGLIIEMVKGIFEGEFPIRYKKKSSYNMKFEN